VDSLPDSLAKLGLELIENEKNGNCMFDSLRDTVGGSTLGSQELRRILVASLREHADKKLDDQGSNGESVTLRSRINTSHGDFDKYLKDMATDRNWGDEPVLVAATIHFQRSVHVVRADGKQTILSAPASFRTEGYNKNNPIVLGYYQDMHYVGTKPILAGSDGNPRKNPSLGHKKVRLVKFNEWNYKEGDEIDSGDKM
jgi:hypothetical protein